MNTDSSSFFKTVKQFRKLKIGLLIKDLNHTDLMILRTIYYLVYGDECINNSKASVSCDMCGTKNMTRNMTNNMSKNTSNNTLKNMTKNMVKVSQVTDNMHINATAVSRSLKGLEERGYIVRTESDKDRRITFVDITKQGIEKLSEADTILNDLSEAVFEKMGRDEVKKLEESLNKLYEIASTEIEARRN